MPIMAGVLVPRRGLMKISGTQEYAGKIILICQYAEGEIFCIRGEIKEAVLKGGRLTSILCNWAEVEWSPDHWQKMPAPPHWDVFGINEKHGLIILDLDPSGGNSMFGIVHHDDAATHRRASPKLGRYVLPLH